MSLTFSRRRGMPGLTMRSVPAPAPVEEPVTATFLAATAPTLGADDLTIAYPAGSGAGDLLIAWMAWGGTGVEVVASGWTIRPLISTTGIEGCFAYRTHPGTGTNATFTDDFANGYSSLGTMVAYQDAASVDDPTSANETDPSTTNHDSGTVTPIAANSLIVACYAIKQTSDTTWTAPDGMDERVDDWHAVPDIALGIFDVVQATTDPVSKTAVSSGQGRGVSYIAALSPAS